MHELKLDKVTQEKQLSITRWTDRLFSFQITKPVCYHFIPGQFARLGLLINDKIIWRAYSIISSPYENILEFLVILVKNGLFTSVLNCRLPGDFIWLDKSSYGVMTINRFVDGDALWMLATGTGLGPFISMLEYYEIWQKFRYLILVHCVGYTKELVYQKKLKIYQKKANKLNISTQFHLVQTITRESKSYSKNFLHERITTMLNNGVLERYTKLMINPNTSRLMICGNPNMIIEVRKILRERGLFPYRRSTNGHFITEGYW